MSAPSLFVPQRSIRTLALLALIIGLVLLSAPARAAILTVNNGNDDGAGSLRQAIVDANAGDTITFDDKFSITLTSGELSITKSLTIDGDLDDDGAPDITVSGNNAHRVFNMSGPVTVTLAGLVITGGNGGGGGGIYASGGTLTVTHSTVSGNSVGVGGSGGGIYAFDETLTVAHSTVSGNSAGSGGSDGGGGIYAFGGTLTVTHSTVSGNSVGVGGGGIYAAGGTLTVAHSTVSGNSAVVGGGGITADSETLTVTNSTFASNSAAGNGGALFIFHSPTARVTNATFSGNSAIFGSGGAIFNAGSSLALTNVILWGNTAPTDPQIHNESGTTTVTYSVVQGGYAGTGNLNADPLFADAANGDFRLLPGSPAIDAGTNTGAPSDDLRDLPRPFNTTTDIGAYEWQGLTLSKSGGDNQSTTINTAFANPLTVTVSSAAPPPQAEPVTGAQVAFTAPASGSSAALNPTSPVTVTCSGSPAVCTASIAATANGIAGTYALSASATGAIPITFSLTNSPASAAVILSDLGPYTYDGAAKSATCTTTPSGLTTSITYDGVTTAPTNAGNYAVVCTVTDANYTGSANGTLTIAKADQIITFNPPASGIVGGNAALSATASSGLSVIFSSQTTSVCTVSGGTVSYLTAGACTVRASQAGNANYNAAPDVDRNITIGPAANTTALTSSANPSTFSQSVTFTATVAGQNPTGAVAFGADGAPLVGCEAVALAGSGNSKTAACTTNALSGGNHAIAAAYGGDANNQPSNGSLQQVVQNVFTGPSATGQGAVTATFSGGGTGCNLTQAALVDSPNPLPAGYAFPYGLLRFTLGGACDSSAVTVQVIYPAALPAGAKYWKYGKTARNPAAHWYEIPTATIAGATATFTLTDGGLGDDDLTVNGRIADDGGAGVPATDIPTLGEWAMLLLAGLLGLFGMRRVRRA